MELGWIDFSKEDRKKALDVISMLSENGAVDELGIGIVRDAFSNYFFPGTSTVQTRAKYFFIVPYAIKDIILSSKIKTLRDALTELNSIEKECGQIMYRNSDKKGLIGANNLPHGWVQRTPSDIYWNGIKKYGLVKNPDMSISDLLHYSIVMTQEKKENAKLLNKADDADDDQDDADAANNGFFHYLNIPTYTIDWKDSLSLTLTSEEAEHLRKQIIHSVPDSLMAYILKNNIDMSVYDTFYDFSRAISPSVSKEQKETIKLANDFNKLVYLMRVRYNYLLSDGQNSDTVKMWNDIEFIDELNVDISKIFSFLKLNNLSAKVFLQKALEYAKCRDFDSLDKLLKQREIRLKGMSRAKLNHIGEYDPEKWVGGYYLDFRFNRAKAIINDIYEGERTDAKT